MDILEAAEQFLAHEALDPDSAKALRPKGIKKAESETPAVGRKKREPVDPQLRRRAIDWNRYRTQNPQETPEQSLNKIRHTFAQHEFRLIGRALPGVESYTHPAHHGHVVHLLHGGPERPEGAPEGPSWYHHDAHMVAHNQGYDHESLDVHLGQFFGTGPEGPRMDIPEAEVPSGIRG